MIFPSREANRQVCGVWGYSPANQRGDQRRGESGTISYSVHLPSWGKKWFSSVITKFLLLIEEAIFWPLFPLNVPPCLRWAFFSLLCRPGRSANHQTHICQGGKGGFRLSRLCLDTGWLSLSHCHSCAAVRQRSDIGPTQSPHKSNVEKPLDFWCDVFSMSFFTGRHTKMLWVNSDLGRALAPTVEWCRYWCITSSVLLRWCVAMNSCWGTEDKLWLLILTSLRVYWAGQAVPEEGKSKDDLWGGVKGNPCLREMHGAQSTYPRRQLAGSVSKCLNKEE